MDRKISFDYMPGTRREKPITVRVDFLRALEAIEDKMRTRIILRGKFSAGKPSIATQGSYYDVQMPVSFFVVVDGNGHLQEGIQHIVNINCIFTITYQAITSIGDCQGEDLSFERTSYTLHGLPQYEESHKVITSIEEGALVHSYDFSKSGIIFTPPQ